MGAQSLRKGPGWVFVKVDIKRKILSPIEVNLDTILKRSEFLKIGLKWPFLKLQIVVSQIQMIKIRETYFFNIYFHWLEFGPDLRTSRVRFCQILMDLLISFL